MKFRHLLVACTLSGVAMLTSAKDNRGPIQLVVGYPPGGPADTAARIVAEGMSVALGQPILIDNRPGAGGQIAAQYVKGAPGDGSVVFLSNIHTVITLPITTKSPRYQLTDFKPVGMVASFELALAVHPTASAKTMSQLGKWAATNPNSLSIGVPAAASVPEFIATKIAASFNANSVPINYKGSGPMVQDIVSGQIPVAVGGIADFLQYHKAGRLQIIAVTQKTPLVPDVPSFAESGLTGLELPEYLALYMPATTDADTVKRYNAALNTALKSPDVVQKFRAQIMRPMPGSPAEQADILNNVQKLLVNLVRESGFKPQ